MIYDFFRWFAVITAFPVQLLFFKRKTYYEDSSQRRPWKKGGALIISNHYNFFDYVLNMFLVLPRKLNVVASEMPYQNRLLAFGMRFWGGIQANRITKSMKFMDQSAEVIRRGQLVQIFPEGQNTPDGTIKAFKQSYIVIAHRARSPIIPIVTDGNYGFFKRTHVLVGKPIYVSDYIKSEGPFPTRDELRQTNEIIHGRVLAMREELETLKAASKKSRRK